jgi:cyclopropane fatty-acyl-phospholipid synthase-like methyltransferase
MTTWRPWLLFAALSAGCAASPSAEPPATASAPTTSAPTAGAPEPTPVASGQHEHGDAHHEHGDAHHHGHGDGPLVHRFDQDPEVWAKRFDRPGRDATQKPTQVVAAMKITPGMEVADIGTGTGYFLPHLSPAVGAKGHVHALDIEPKLIEYVQKRAKREKLANVVARVVKVDDPMLPAAGLDRILLVNTWHHIPSREAYVVKLAAGLKPGGQVWVVDYKMSASDGPPKEHRIEPAQIEKELSAGGLSTRVDTALLPDQFIVIGTKKP